MKNILSVLIAILVFGLVETSAQVDSVLFAENDTSEVFLIDNFSPVLLTVPADFKGNQLTFLTSDDGINYGQVWLSDSTLYTVKIPDTATVRKIGLYPTDIYFFDKYNIMISDSTQSDSIYVGYKRKGF